jgi:predicted RNase H-like nuclease (RuvC/YqgF family)
MSNLPELLFGTGAAAAAAAAWRFLRTDAGQAFLTKLRRLAGTEVVALKEAVENLAQVVGMQGESIDWLRAELDLTRAELASAREALNNKENHLEQENEKLRCRVAELEAQVKALENILAKKSRVPAKKTVKSTGGRK